LECQAAMGWSGAHGKVHQVRCKVYTKMEDNEKFLAPKLDSL